MRLAEGGFRVDVRREELAEGGGPLDACGAVSSPVEDLRILDGPLDVCGVVFSPVEDLQILLDDRPESVVSSRFLRRVLAESGLTRSLERTIGLSLAASEVVVVRWAGEIVTSRLVSSGFEAVGTGPSGVNLRRLTGVEERRALGLTFGDGSGGKFSLESFVRSRMGPGTKRSAIASL